LATDPAAPVVSSRPAAGRVSLASEGCSGDEALVGGSRRGRSSERARVGPMLPIGISSAAEISS
jgi:hypothetical protein